jgi:hypothetical protein
MTRSSTPLRSATLVLFCSVACAILFFGSPTFAQQSIQVRSAGTVLPQPNAPGIDAFGTPELDPALSLDGADEEILLPGEDPDAPQPADSNAPAAVRPLVNRSVAKHRGDGMESGSHGMSGMRNSLLLSFNGLNHRDQRLANGGNQFSIEPPDQGLCAGNGFVLETVNDVLRVFDANNGKALIGVVDLNSFYGYPAAINRTTGANGPSITDPSCYFDSQTRRWFHLVLTLDRVGTTSTLAGPNHLDLAVSNTSNPLGTWTIYHIPAQNDGTQGTPDHGCQARVRNPTPPPATILVHGPCLGDFPHLGADRNGIYITTNEFDFFGPFFRGAQVYAISKQALVSGANSISVFLFNTGEDQFLLDDAPGFTIAPATSPKLSNGDDGGNGTEFFLSSVAVFSDTGTDNRLRLWGLSGTRSLNSPSPSLALSSTVVNVAPYAVPPRSGQKAGDFPLGQCLNDTTTVITSLGPPFVGCWQAIVAPPEPPHNQVESQRVDSSDSRMHQTVFADGKLFAALDTAVSFGNTTQAGIAYFVIEPEAHFGSVEGELEGQGVLALANNNLTYPAVGITAEGKGVIAFTLLGADFYPSAAYVSIDDEGNAGSIQMAAAGLGPDDGFTAYPLIGGTRNRWGDYGAAAADGKFVWIASEYIGQTCTLAQYVSAPFGSCGGTRTSLANWGTRISKLLP